MRVLAVSSAVAAGLSLSDWGMKQADEKLRNGIQEAKILVVPLKFVLVAMGLKWVKMFAADTGSLFVGVQGEVWYWMQELELSSLASYYRLYCCFRSTCGILWRETAAEGWIRAALVPQTLANMACY